MSNSVVSKNQVLYAFLVYEGGILLASRSLDAQPAVDEDIFSAALEAIQRFVKVTFPVFGSKRLSAMNYENFKIILERGKCCCLVLVITGAEDGPWRRMMKEALNGFEEKNAEVSGAWAGDLDALRRAQETVDVLFKNDSQGRDYADNESRKSTTIVERVTEE